MFSPPPSLRFDVFLAFPRKELVRTVRDNNKNGLLGG